MTATNPDVTLEDEVDLEAITPDKGVVMLGDVKVRIRPFKTREMLAMVKIISVGFGAGVANIRLDTSDREQLGADIAAIVAIALPTAVEETFAFLQAITEPVDTTSKGRAAYLREIDNPDIDATLDIVNTVIDQEAERLFGFFEKALRMARSQAERIDQIRARPKSTG